MKKNRNNAIKTFLLIILLIFSFISIITIDNKIGKYAQQKNAFNVIYKQYHSLKNRTLYYFNCYLRTNNIEFKEGYEKLSSVVYIWLDNPFDIEKLNLETDIIEKSEYEKHGISNYVNNDYLQLTDDEKISWNNFVSKAKEHLSMRDECIYLPTSEKISSKEILNLSQTSDKMLKDLNYEYIERLTNIQKKLEAYKFFILIISAILLILLICNSITLLKSIYTYYNKDIYNKRLYDSIFDNMIFGLVIERKRGKYEFLNKAFIDMLDIENDSISIEDIVSDNIEVINKLYELPIEKNKAHNLKFKINDKNIFWIINKFKVEDINKNFKTIYIIKDITIEKKYEKQKEVFKNRLNKSEVEIKVKDKVIANVSHEIRTPLNAIIGMTSFLKETKIDTKQEHFISKIEDSSNILLGIINNILDFVKLSNKGIELEESTFKFSTLVDTVENIFEEQIELKGLKWIINNNVDKNLFVVADSIRLSQVLINLIGNSFKFTNEGFIELGIESTSESRESIIIKFQIKDTGKGIENNNLDKLFLPFEQFDKEWKVFGTGLGLPICKEIIEAMGGDLNVQSTYGVGSTFSFSLELQKGNEIKNESNVIVSKGFESLKNIKILLVDDNEINREIGEMTLNQLGCEYIIVSSGRDAIKICEEKGKNFFNIILMDIQMPDLDGYETSKVLKKDLASESSIIALTATMVDKMNFKKHKDYMEDYILKPIKPDELKIKILNCYNKTNEISTTINSFVDYKDVMDRFDGNMILFEELYKKMKNKYYNSYYELEDLLKKDDYENSRILIHSLNGVAANLGIKDLKELCNEIEIDIINHTIDKENMEKFKVYIEDIMK